MRSCSFSCSTKLLCSYCSDNKSAFLPYLAILPPAISQDCWRFLSPRDQAFSISPAGNQKGMLSSAMKTLFCSLGWVCMVLLATLNSDATFVRRGSSTSAVGREGGMQPFLLPCLLDTSSSSPSSSN